MNCPITVQQRNDASFAVRSAAASCAIAEMESHQRACARALARLSAEWEEAGKAGTFDNSRHATAYDQFKVLEAAEELFAMTHDCIEAAELLGVKADAVAARVAAAERVAAMPAEKRRAFLKDETRVLERHASRMRIDATSRRRERMQQHSFSSFRSTRLRSPEEQSPIAREGLDADGAGTRAAGIRDLGRDDQSESDTESSGAECCGRRSSSSWMTSRQLQRAREDLILLECGIEMEVRRCRVRCEATTTFLNAQRPRRRDELELAQERELADYRVRLSAAKADVQSVTSLHAMMREYAASDFETGWGQALSHQELAGL